MSRDISSPPKALYVAEILAAGALGYMSFGAHCKAERERALAAEIGPDHPAYSVVMDRVSLPVGLAKVFAFGAAALTTMGVVGLAGGRESK